MLLSKKQQNYTIWQAQEDIKFLGSQCDALQSAQKSLEDELTQLRCDEWRALHLCGILKRRVDVLETLLLMALTPEGRKYFTHQVLTELRAAKQPEAAA